jgi:hypothetical protein
MLHYHRVDIIARINVNAPHQLDEFPRFGPIVAAGLVYVLADEEKGQL